MMIFTVSAWFRCSWIRLTDMDLSLRRLRMLRELHRRGTVTAVAEALHYSPSGISQQLAQLERDVGVVLVERFGRRIRLTELGLLLAEHAEDILASVDRASMALEQAQGGVSARLTAGVWASVASGLVTPALGALAKAYPGLEVRTVELAPESTAEAVMDGSLDFSFVIDYMNYPLVWDPTLVREVIAVERLYAAVPAGSIPGTTVALLDLSEHPWILVVPARIWAKRSCSPVDSRGSTRRSCIRSKNSRPHWRWLQVGWAYHWYPISHWTRFPRV